MENRQQNEAQERAEKEAAAQRQIEAQTRRKREKNQPQDGAQGHGGIQPETRAGSQPSGQQPQRNKRSPVVWAGIVLLGLVILGLAVIGLMSLLSPRPLSPAQADIKPPATQTAKPASNNLALAPASAQLGDIWTSPVDGMELVYIPAGEFQMGCDPAHNGGLACQDNELHLHKVTLDAYYIDKTEVTNAQYAKCVAAGACERPLDTSSITRSTYYGDDKYADYPVINVSWEDASKYCKWAGRQLPTEAQWEKAARGESVRAYPWGDTSPTCDLVNAQVGGVLCAGDTTAVGSYPDSASPYGVLDMAGNVWEWVSDWYSETYYSSLERFINPVGPSTGTYKVIRGGSFSDDYGVLRTAFRGYLNQDSRDARLGFRCAAPPTP